MNAPPDSCPIEYEKWINEALNYTKKDESLGSFMLLISGDS